MSAMNRRAILAGTASLPAISIPALAAKLDPALASCSYPDLARQWMAIYERWLAASQEDKVKSGLFQQRTFERTGLRHGEWPLPPDDSDFRLVFREVSDELDRDPVDEHDETTRRAGDVAQ
jgi:hypothetical protein